jgi:Spy/CpxP family protein refolding chaperone
MLLGSDAVKKEIELDDEQAGKVTKLGEELRNQPRPDMPNFRDMSEADREKAMEDLRKRGQEQAKQTKAKVAEILLPHQLERLEQISLQASLRMGLATALSNEETATKLKITPEQKTKLEAIQGEVMAAMREMFQGGGQGGDREGMREKMDAARKGADTKAEGVLTAEQKAELEKLKGKAFEFPEGGFFGGRGGPGGGDRAKRRPGN